MLGTGPAPFYVFKHAHFSGGFCGDYLIRVLDSKHLIYCGLKIKAYPLKFKKTKMGSSFTGNFSLVGKCLPGPLRDAITSSLGLLEGLAQLHGAGAHSPDV